MKNSEKELRKELESLLSISVDYGYDGYHDFLRDIVFMEEEMKGTDDDSARNIFFDEMKKVDVLFNDWTKEYYDCKTIDELNVLLDKVHNTFDELLKKLKSVEEQYDKWWLEHASEEEKEEQRKLEEKYKINGGNI